MFIVISYAVPFQKLLLFILFFVVGLIVKPRDGSISCLWAAVLSVYVDKRMKLATFKRHLEFYVGVPSSQFKVFRVYASNQEFESVRLNETLSSFSDDNRVRNRRP